MSKVTIIVRADHKQGVTADGKKYDFYAYTATTKKGELARIKFTKAVKNAPEEVGYFNVTTDTTQINKDNRLAFLTYWIKSVDSVTPYEPEVKENLDF